MTASKEREEVLAMYPSETWKKKVNAMPDAQVLAIYFKKQKDDAEKASKEQKEPETLF